MTGTHQARRPEWICPADREPWPCRHAQRLLQAGYTGPDQLIQDLSWLMAQAMDDTGTGPCPALYRRFVAWALPESTQCRVCGKPGHDLVPGLPPRLQPPQHTPDDINLLQLIAPRGSRRPR